MLANYLLQKSSAARFEHKKSLPATILWVVCLWLKFSVIRIVWSENRPVRAQFFRSYADVELIWVEVRVLGEILRKLIRAVRHGSIFYLLLFERRLQENCTLTVNLRPY